VLLMLPGLLFLLALLLLFLAGFFGVGFGLLLLLEFVLSGFPFPLLSFLFLVLFLSLSDLVRPARRYAVSGLLVCGQLLFFWFLRDRYSPLSPMKNSANSPGWPLARA